MSATKVELGSRLDLIDLLQEVWSSCSRSSAACSARAFLDFLALDWLKLKGVGIVM